VAAGHGLKIGRVLKASCGCCTAEPAGRICPSGFPRQVPAGDDWPQWEDAGVFVELWHAFIGTLDEQGLVDWEQVFLDGSFAPVKKGAPTSAKPSVERVRSGWWWQMAKEFLWHAGASSASPAEVTLAEKHA
jgi:hypothetical protein